MTKNNIKYDAKYAKIGTNTTGTYVSNFNNDCYCIGSKVSFNIANGLYLAKHTHEYYEININNGSPFYNSVDGKVSIFKKGDAYLILYDNIHQFFPIPNTTDKEYCVYNIMIEKKVFDEICQMYGQKFEKFVKDKHNRLLFHLNEIELNEILEKLDYISNFPRMDIYEHEHLSKNILFQLLIYLSEKLIKNEEYPDWLTSLLQKLKDIDYLNKSIGELAEECGYSLSHFSRKFKEYMGVPVIQFIIDKKITYAKQLLSSSDKSILDISIILGFSSVSHFNHIFKEATEITPSEYRKIYWHQV